MDILDEFENWQVGAAIILIIGLISSAGYLAFGNIAGTQTYTLEGDLMKFHEATDAVEAERLYMTDTGSCDSPVVGEYNISSNQVEMSFTVEDYTVDSEQNSQGFNWVSFCLETNYGELKSHVNNLGELKERANQSDNLPGKISFTDAQGEHVFEIRNLEIKETVK